MVVIGSVKPKYGTYARDIAVRKVTGPSSYPAGGFDYTPELSSPSFVIVICNGPYIAKYSDGKIQVFYFDYDASADGAAIEVAGGTDLSGVEFIVVEIG